jgi:hypothetical protein
VLQNVTGFGSASCSIFCFLKKRKKEKKEKGEMAGGLFPRADRSYCSATPGFFQLLGEIESCFKGQFLNFMCT